MNFLPGSQALAGTLGPGPSVGRAPCRGSWEMERSRGRAQLPGAATREETGQEPPEQRERSRAAGQSSEHGDQGAGLERLPSGWWPQAPLDMSGPGAVLTAVLYCTIQSNHQSPRDTGIVNILTLQVRKLRQRAKNKHAKVESQQVAGSGFNWGQFNHRCVQQTPLTHLRHTSDALDVCAVPAALPMDGAPGKQAWGTAPKMLACTKSETADLTRLGSLRII